MVAQLELWPKVDDGVNRGRKKNERYNLYLAHLRFLAHSHRIFDRLRARRKTGHSRALVAEFWPSVRHYRGVLASVSPDIPLRQLRTLQPYSKQHRTHSERRGHNLRRLARQRLGRNWSQTVSVKEGHELVTSGPYRHIRHPMYTGGFIACLGSAIVAGGAFVFLLLFLGAIFLWRVGSEDKLMEQQFPNEYPDYKKRTKAVIPFVW